MTRRAYGTGTVHHLGGDVWRLMVPLGSDPVTGNRRRASRNVRAGSQAAAEHALAEFRAELRITLDEAPLRDLLRDFLYSDDHDKDTRRRLRDLIEARLAPNDRPPVVSSLPTNTGWVVYVARSSDDRVLYVGMSGNLWSRMGDWQRSRTWWPESARVEWHSCPTKAAAAALERALIVEHRPPYNTSQCPPDEQVA